MTNEYIEFIDFQAEEEKSAKSDLVKIVDNMSSIAIRDLIKLAHMMHNNNGIIERAMREYLTRSDYLVFKKDDAFEMKAKALRLDKRKKGSKEHAKKMNYTADLMLELLNK